MKTKLFYKIIWNRIWRRKIIKAKNIPNYYKNGISTKLFKYPYQLFMFMGDFRFDWLFNTLCNEI